MNKLKNKYDVEHIKAGSHPNGYDIKEKITLTNKENQDLHIDISRNGAVVSKDRTNEVSSDYEAYQDMGIETDSKEFKGFEEGLKDPKNFNTKYVEEFLEKAPEMTAEKSKAIYEQREIDFQAALDAYHAKGSSIDPEQEFIDKHGMDYADAAQEQGLDDAEYLAHKDEPLNEIQTSIAIQETQNKGVLDKEQEYSEQGKTEIAAPGRTYTGKVIEVGEDTTIQKTKSGKFIIHETENLPGIKEQDSGAAAKIVYNAGGKGDITAKSNDMDIAKEKEAKKGNDYDKHMER